MSHIPVDISTVRFDRDVKFKGTVTLDDVKFKGTVTLDKAPVQSGAGLKSLQFTAALADFTDGGAAVGTYTHTVAIPVGAIVTQSTITAVTGFAGDTSAVITIGDGTDVDRYNTGTPSVFATAANVSAGAVSGTAYHAAAKAPVLTVTTASDFTSVTAGSVTITIFYYEA